MRRKIDGPSRASRWLAMRRSGMSCVQIARKSKVSRATVYRGLEAAREAERAAVRATLEPDAA